MYIYVRTGRICEIVKSVLGRIGVLYDLPYVLRVLVRKFSILKILSSM